MEVADQWRREWAGTAEYGKVTEGGVTRRIARAMEVLHASGPGARVRVMRAAYHSSAAPGAPAASFMLHSSRRVISSGFNFLESPSTPIKPLEISSTPIESSPEPNTETENYKVTEPDDFEISEPSKWRGSTGSSIRMPSEESSSTDNASIIDLDSRLGKNLQRKYSYDSECSDIQFSSRNNSRNSPLLDTPVTLSTLKYKSLLNSSNEWNIRRKSYSFEDTSPLKETIIHSNDTLAMESSTDSGICKSSEIVNDHMDDSTKIKYFSKDERRKFSNEESFTDWLSKNRPISHYRGTKFKTYREHDTVMEDPVENNITLQSSGKVSITLPITVETDCDTYPKKNQVTEEGERKVKKVEFCKTEVHFTAESGKVNIIATDEKPPPSTDFRKRRSAFVPMKDMIEKPITLFGEKNDFSITKVSDTTLNFSGSEFGECDENTAATKSILKNKIPKPKPYLLGENMVFGMSDNISNKDPYNDSVLTAVSLVNKQLETEKHYNGEVNSIFPRKTNESVIKPHVFRTNNTGPTKTDCFKQDKHVITHIKINKATEETIDDVKNKLNGLQISPSQRKPKTRQLRESDLTYFGVDNDQKDIHKDRNTLKSKLAHSNNVTENILHSVKLIQQVSNSVYNSEPESEETPEYQNIPLNINYAPVPTPRLRSKYDDKSYGVKEIQVLKPIIEKESQDTKDAVSSTRRARFRRQDEITTSRSFSAPPKALRCNSIDKSHRQENQSARSSNYQSLKENATNDEKIISSTNERNSLEDDIPIYVNLNCTEKSKISENRDIQKLKTNSLNSRQRRSYRTHINKNKIEPVADSPTSDFNYHDRMKERRSDSETDSNLQTKLSISKDTLSRSAYKDTPSKRAEKTEKLRTSDMRGKTHEELNTSRRARKSLEGKLTNTTTEKKNHRSRSLQRPKSKSEETSKDISPIIKKAEQQLKDSFGDKHDASHHRNRNTSKDKTNSSKGSIKPSLKQDLSPTAHNSSAQTKNNEKSYGTKSNNHKTNKRNEYVINYDDKNGTVSSICKIKPSLGTPTRKKTSKEIFKDNHIDKSLKNKTVDKIAPLQLQDHQEDRTRLSYADRKWKTKVHVQRSCQLL